MAIPKLSGVMVSVFFLFLPVNSAFGILADPLSVTDRGGVIMVDGKDADSTVSGVVFQINGSTEFDFGFVDGTGFNQIVANGSQAGVPVSWGAFDAGQVVNFAIRQPGPNTIFSLTNSDPVKTFSQLVDNMGIDPTPNVSYYYNTLSIDWVGVPGNFSLSILDAGSEFDGFAPVPIPSAALLFGTGLIGLIAIARRSVFGR